MIKINDSELEEFIYKYPTFNPIKILRYHMEIIKSLYNEKDSSMETDLEKILHQSESKITNNLQVMISKYLIILIGILYTFCFCVYHLLKKEIFTEKSLDIQILILILILNFTYYYKIGSARKSSITFFLFFFILMIYGLCFYTQFT